jgi:hypothetical protein
MVVPLLFILNITIAQEIEFGEISKEELLEKEYPGDIDAHAAVLYKHSKTFFLSTNGTESLVTDVIERIKIYDKEGFDYATESVTLFKTRGNNERIKKIKAFTYNLEGGKIVKSELDKDQIFETEYSYNYDQVKFTMPNVKEGSVIEFKYQISSPFIWNIDDFVFQYDIPVKQLYASIRTPKGFNFKSIPKGFLSFYPRSSTKMDHRIGMDVVLKEYSLKNIPALKSENYVDNMDNYRAGVMFELLSIDLPDYFKSYSRSWQDVAQAIGNTDDYKNELDKTNAFDDELTGLLEGVTDELEKLELIFKYVKDNVKWNGIDGKYFYNGLRKSIKEKKGNAADMNLLVVAMLRYAGIDANPVIVSTKDNTIPFFPTLDRLNHVIAYALIDGKKYFLDATEEFSDVNVLPIKDYNWRGVYVDNNKETWKLIDIDSPPTTQNVYSISASLNADGSAEGKFRSRYTNHAALKFRKNFKNKDEDLYLSELESAFKDIEISEYEVKNEDTYKGPVSESFSFLNENAADIVNDKLYVTPISFLRMEENPFKLEERQFPVDFGYPMADRYIINIVIPEGYMIESVPDKIMIALPESMGRFSYLVSATGNQIKLSVKLEIDKAMIPANAYAYLKEFFNQVIIKESEQVVLKKI